VIRLTSINNKKGFTLTELLVAIVIMMVGMLALLQASNVVIEYNLKNHLRDEAITIGEKYMNELKGQGFNATDLNTLTVASNIRGSGRTYTVERSSTVLASDSSGPTSKQLQVTVRWKYRQAGEEFQNRVLSVISKL
jgi:type IV pilus assembly protein PilV